MILSDVRALATGDGPLIAVSFRCRLRALDSQADLLDSALADCSTAAPIEEKPMKAPLRLYLALLILSCAVSFAPEPLYSQEPGVLSMADHAKVLEAILKNNAAIIKVHG